MRNIVLCILTLLFGCCGPGGSGVEPKLCGATCSSNIECNASFGLCRFCNGGVCSQTALPPATTDDAGVSQGSSNETWSPAESGSGD